MTRDLSSLCRGLAGAVAAAAALTLTATMAPASASLSDPASPNSQAAVKQRPVDVMTRNLYLGADLQPVIAAMAAPPSPTDPLRVPRAAGATWNAVQATNPPERMAALAQEIAEQRPAVVGLQEVTRWRTYTYNPATGQASNPKVVYDFLDMLLDALEAEGVSYREVGGATANNFTSPPIPFAAPNTFPVAAVELQDRDVILARGDVATSNARNGNFTNIVRFPVAGQPPLDVDRGWGSVDVVANRSEFRFVNSHLEAFGPAGTAEAIRVLQVDELLTAQDAIAAAKPLPVVYVGDYNSRAPSGPAYLDLVEGVGYDAWTVTQGADPGFTCCVDAAVTDETATHSQRIDLVLYGEGVKADSAEIIGEEVDDMTTSGLWPSDHAGVVARLIIGHDRGVGGSR